MTTIIPYRPAEIRSLCIAVTGVIEGHGVIGIPTETYYGLGVNPYDAGALRRVAAMKGRPEGKPILVLIGAREQLDELAAVQSPLAALIVERFWPGPLTIAFPARPGLPDELTAGIGTVGVRWTSCEPIAAVLREVGPLTGTSANRSGTKPFRTAIEVERALGGQIDFIIDAGTTPGGPPSTVVRIDRDGVEVLREGAIASSVLKRVLGEQGFHLKTGDM